MTEEIKKFIELSDVLSLKLTCKHCVSELSIPSSRDMLRPEERGKLNDCPVCGRNWATVNESSCEITIAKFVDALNQLRGTLKNFPAGFSFMLEIKNPKVTPPSTSGKSEPEP
jgi:hypothetical protein